MMRWDVMCLLWGNVTISHLMWFVECNEVGCYVIWGVAIFFALMWFIFICYDIKSNVGMCCYKTRRRMNFFVEVTVYYKVWDDKTQFQLWPTGLRQGFDQPPDAAVTRPRRSLTAKLFKEGTPSPATGETLCHWRGEMGEEARGSTPPPSPTFRRSDSVVALGAA